VKVILCGAIRWAAPAGVLLLPTAPFAFLSGCTAASSDPATKPLLIVGSQGLSPGKLYHPRAVAVDAKTGRFYVVDRSGRIQLFEAQGKLALEWRLPEHALGQPVGLAIEADGSLLVNDSHYHRILRYASDGSSILARWGTEGTGPGQLTFGRDVVVDSKGFIYAGDYGGLNDRILKFSHDGAFLLAWGGVGEEPGKFQRPQGMAIERRKDGEFLLVADAVNHRVQRFTREGRFVSSIGTLGRGPGELRFPYSVAVGTDGAIYVCEWGNNRVQRFDAEGRSQGSWGNAGRAEGELATPWDIALGPEDRIYIADYGNHRVQVFRWPVAVAAVSVAPWSRREEVR
jgi:DNA-binding beta-propeller fold protein YncE